MPPRAQVRLSCIFGFSGLFGSMAGATGITGGVFVEYVEDYFGPRTTQMAADRLPQ